MNDDEEVEKQTTGKALSAAKSSPSVEYLENDDEDDEKQTIGVALNAAKDSPSFDVSRVIQSNQCECKDVGVMCW